MRVLIPITVVVLAALVVAALPAGKEDPKAAALAKRAPATAAKPAAPASVAKRSASATAAAPKPAAAAGAKRATGATSSSKSSKVSKRHSKSKSGSPVKRSVGRAFADPAAEFAQAKLARAKRLAKP